MVKYNDNINGYHISKIIIGYNYFGLSNFLINYSLKRIRTITRMEKETHVLMTKNDMSHNCTV